MTKRVLLGSLMICRALIGTLLWNIGYPLRRDTSHITYRRGEVLEGGILLWDKAGRESTIHQCKRLSWICEVGLR